MLFLLLGAFLAQQAVAQTVSPYVKFGKITPADLQRTVYSIDSSAAAVVLSDIGESMIVGNSKSSFSVQTRRHRVVHVLQKNGYREADVKITLHNRGDVEEKLEYLKVVTYNLEGGKVAEARLEKNNIFREKVDKNRSVVKFTFPAVKEGSILEYDYQVVSDFVDNIDPWFFQEIHAPVLWSEYVFSVPQFYTYNFLGRGYRAVDINEKSNHTQPFTVRLNNPTGPAETVKFNSGVTDYRWVMKNVPEMKEEQYTSSILNHLSHLEFQLASQSEPLPYYDFRSSWGQLAKRLLESEYFGSGLKSGNGWLSDDFKTVSAGSLSAREKAYKVFAFLRDNFTTTGNAGIYTDQSLKATFKARKGTVSEINLLLVAMLRYAGVDADPVILSTRGHGFAHESSPMTSAFNYVVARFYDGNNIYYLDATEPRLGFGRLPYYCFNGHARIVNDEATPIHLSADSVKEGEITQIIITNNEKGGWTGATRKQPGYNESFSIRNRIAEKGKEAYFSEIAKGFADITLANTRIDSLTRYEEPLVISYDMQFPDHTDELLYINPLFSEAYKKNPFAAARRDYPVEMPYTTDETVLVSIEVPKGYVIDELPKQSLVKFDEEGKSFFEYRLSVSENIISLRSRIRLNRALFMPDEYEILREFFNFVVKKQGEQIVFKKKK